jgi:hypothetical protein
MHVASSVAESIKDIQQVKLCMFCIALRCGDAVICCVFLSFRSCNWTCAYNVDERGDGIVGTGQNLAGNGSVFGIVVQSGIPGVA